MAKEIKAWEITGVNLDQVQNNKITINSWHLGFGNIKTTLTITPEMLIYNDED